MKPTKKPRTKELIPREAIQSRILLIRGYRVLLDRDLAELYGVQTKHLNRQVRRNSKKFPERYVFQLTRQEKKELVTNWHRFRSLKHSSSPPYAFTEHGVAMVATVLNSDRAAWMTIFIIDAFIGLRDFLSTHKELARKIEELERKIGKHEETIQGIIKAIKQLMALPDKPRKKTGF